MRTPNLFNLATRELSHDAFITWMLQWAASENEAADKELTACAQAFVKHLISKQYPDWEGTISKVQAGRQRENIDVWAEVNDEYLIVIEDKINTGEHSNQLERYKKSVSAYIEGEAGKNLKPVYIYLKIGEESRASFELIRQRGWAVVTRKELINLFNHYRDIDNAIFQEYLSHLVAIQEATERFESTPIKDWDYNCWNGLYNYLEENIHAFFRGYVPNHKGGFLCFCWNKNDKKDCSFYLQIESEPYGNLCFKIGEVEEKQTEIRSKYYDIVCNSASEKGFLEIHKPSSFGKGYYMTVCVVDREQWLGPDDSIINKEEVVARLKKYASFLDDCSKLSN